MVDMHAAVKKQQRLNFAAGYEGEDDTFHVHRQLKKLHLESLLHGSRHALSATQMSTHHTLKHANVQLDSIAVAKMSPILIQNIHF